MSMSSPPTILIADDDEDDVLLAGRALAEAGVSAGLRSVRDGDELLDYLRRRGGFTLVASSPEPSLVLLDLNMPRRDGRDALREIKADPALRHIPVVIFTTSRAEEEVASAYALGANSFLRKPRSFQRLVEVMALLRGYWLETVELPRRHP